MTKITTKPNCGNSPKQEFLKDINIAFAQGHSKVLIESATDEIVWEIVGDKTIEGIARFAEELKTMKEAKAQELVLERIITHGKEGAVSGILKMENGNRYAFSDFYEFSSAKGNKIKSITSYVIEI